MAAVVGFAFLVTVVTPCGKRVFLLVVTTIPNAMRLMATTAATVKKAAFGRSKSPPLAVKKQLRIEALPQTLLKAPLHPSPRCGSPFPLILRMFWCCSFPLEKAGMGPLCWDGACSWLVRTPGNSVGVAIS